MMIRYLLLFPVLLVGACLSVLPEPEAPRGLYSINGSRAGFDLAHIVTIREFEAPRIMAGSGLVSESDSGAMRILRSVEWSDRLTRLLQLALVDSFSDQGRGAAVLPEVGVGADYRASGRVHKLVLREDVAVCEVSMIVTDLRRKTLVAKLEARAEVPVLARSTEERALSLAAAASSCSLDLAASMSRALAAELGEEVAP